MLYNTLYTQCLCYIISWYSLVVCIIGGIKCIVHFMLHHIDAYVTWCSSYITHPSFPDVIVKYSWIIEINSNNWKYTQKMMLGFPVSTRNSSTHHKEIKNSKAIMMQTAWIAWGFKLSFKKMNNLVSLGDSQIRDSESFSYLLVSSYSWKFDQALKLTSRPADHDRAGRAT